MQKYDIDVLHEDGMYVTLVLTISHLIGLKEHYGGLRNTYGNIYQVVLAIQVFIEDGLTDENKPVTIESLKKFEESYFKPECEIRAIRKEDNMKTIYVLRQDIYFDEAPFPKH